jgi:glycosyltransferase involved in cell wall biosynthesis
MKPLVDICLPTFRRPAWLKESLESVISQQGVDVHLILMDNGSNCLETDTVIEQMLPRFKNPTFIKKESNDFDNIPGIWKHVRGDYVVEFTDDDRMLPRNLYEKVCLLQKHDAGIAFSPAFHIGPDGQRKGKIVGGFRRQDGTTNPTFDDLFPASRLVMPSVVMTRTAFELQFDGYTIGSEWGRHLAIVGAGHKCVQVCYPMVELRIHGGSDTNTRGFYDGKFLDMHLHTWKHWIQRGYYPPQIAKNDMYKVYCDLAWDRYQEGPMFAEAVQKFCNIWL